MVNMYTDTSYKRIQGDFRLYNISMKINRPKCKERNTKHSKVENVLISYFFILL